MKKRKRSAYKRGINQSAQYLLLVFIFFLIIFLIRKWVHKDENRLPALIEQVSSFHISGDVLYHLKEIGEEIGMDYIEAVTLFSMENGFIVEENNLISKEDLYKFCTEDIDQVRKKHKKKDRQNFYMIYQQTLKDINVFPIPDIGEYIYANSWGADRDYGGPRRHLGTDIIDVHNNPGSIPILSMTDGIVEQMGWNEKGGWRIGIRTPSGAYFYYAHLDSFSHAIKEGTVISSGQCLGYMGDSGYGKEPGTVGNFPVHLHLGIMLNLSFTKEEVWINPYHILKFAEYNKISWNKFYEREVLWRNVDLCNRRFTSKWRSS